MKKTYFILIIVVVIVVGLGVAIFWMQNNNTVDPDATNLNGSDSATVYGNAVEYQDSMGAICPLGIRLLGARTANPIACDCPEGYHMETETIGYASGAACYGVGTECPILSSECVQ